MTEYEALVRAVEILGGQTGTARFLSQQLGVEVKQQYVWNWLRRHKNLPDRYVLAMHYGTVLKGEPIAITVLKHDWFAFFNPKFQVAANDSIISDDKQNCNSLNGSIEKRAS